MRQTEVAEQVSPTERIVSATRPGGVTVFVHQFRSEGHWRQCTHCGDRIRTRPGPVADINHIKRYCSAYRSG